MVGGDDSVRRLRRQRVVLVALIAVAAWWLVRPGALSGVRAAAITVLARLPSSAPLGDDERARKDGEIAALRAELVRISDQLLLERLERRRAQALAATLGAAARSSWRVVPARVIQRSEPRSGLRELVVARGSDDRITPGMPAVVGRAIVGRVVEVTPTTARVALLTDPRCRLTVRLLLPPRDAEGKPVARRRLVLGASVGRVQAVALKLIPVEQTPPVGTQVLTAGEGMRVPAGLVIGQVSRVEEEGGRYEAEIDVEPAADLTQIERVLLIDLIGQLAARERDPDPDDTDQRND